jgi:hypothetical protein
MGHELRTPIGLLYGIHEIVNGSKCPSMLQEICYGATTNHFEAGTLFEYKKGYLTTKRIKYLVCRFQLSAKTKQNVVYRYQLKWYKGTDIPAFITTGDKLKALWQFGKVPGKRKSN